MWKNLVLFTLSLLLAFLGGEVLLALLGRLNDFDSFTVNYRDYTPEEKNPALPMYTDDQGGACVRRIPADRMNYHPYFGFSLGELDRICARDLLQRTKDSVVFMGGSVMANTYAPNHLTTIDHFVHEAWPGIFSLNLAESGSRSTNELVRFLLEVIDLKPAIVIFLDGFNEYNSIRYGGSPEDDFYWTAGVEDRVERPFVFLRDKALSSSKILTIALYQTRLIVSPRGPQPEPSPEATLAASAHYVRNQTRIQSLCVLHGIRCFFFLQPTLYTKQKRSPVEDNILLTKDRGTPGGGRVMARGYAAIKDRAEYKVEDLSEIFTTEETLYFDTVHLNRQGNRLLAEELTRRVRAAR